MKPAWMLTGEEQAKLPKRERKAVARLISNWDAEPRLRHLTPRQLARYFEGNGK